jgi:hypothetical protein
LWLLSDRLTQSKEKTLDLLLTTHFTISEVTQELVAAADTLHARRSDRRLAVRVITYRRVELAFLAPDKSTGMDGIFPALLLEGREVVIPYLVRIFHACLSTGCVQDVCRQVKIMFIPKPGRNS